MHILKTQQFSREWLEGLFRETARIEKVFESGPAGRAKLRSVLKGRLMYSVFCEPSTRTRFSFESAAAHLGMSVVSTENGMEFSSLVKNESLGHMMEVLCRYYPNVIVLRHREDGASESVAPIATKHRVCLINGGDGASQHPTQSLVDVFTINALRGSVDNMTVVVGGDLLYGRTVKSLVYLLSKFKKVRFIFVSPPQLRMDQGVLNHLNEHRVPFKAVCVCGTAISKVLAEADVVYWSRTQSERITDATERQRIAMSAPLYRITQQHAVALEKSGGILLHPLPIAGEIENSVDGMKCAKYFEQAGYGLFVRMALLRELIQA